MKSNRRGFTLIELLAVIVILAIVALIATPIILNVINDSRRKAAVDSSYGIIKSIQLAYAQNQTSSSPLDANSQEITFSGSNTDYKINNATPISIGGDIPTTGRAILSRTTGQVQLINIQFGSYYCSTYGNTNNKVCCVTASSTPSATANALCTNENQQ